MTSAITTATMIPPTHKRMRPGGMRQIVLGLALEVLLEESICFVGERFDESASRRPNREKISPETITFFCHKRGPEEGSCFADCDLYKISMQFFSSYAIKGLAIAVAKKIFPPQAGKRG